MQKKSIIGIRDYCEIVPDIGSVIVGFVEPAESMSGALSPRFGGTRVSRLGVAGCTVAG